MIIKALKSDGHWSFHWAYLLFPLVIGAFWLYPSVTGGSTSSTGVNILCDAETVVGNNFITQGNTLSQGITQSSEKSFSGKYSSKVDGKNKYGMTINIPQLSPKLRYSVSIRRWTLDPNLSALAVNGNAESNFHLQTSTASFKDDDGWELLKLDFDLPSDGSVTSLTIFPYSVYEDGIAYYDDLKLETFDFEVTQLPELHFYLDNKAVNKLETKRNEAMQRGVLKTEDNDWVKAKLTIDQQEEQTEVKLRLKGDWTDHLQGDYWSYRVQMPADRSWNRLQTFSLQNPETRFYLHEWLYHKALESIDVITPRYGFVLLTQNTKKQVLYAYEEHFDKQIAEYKDRREGVIVKFSENYFWDRHIRNSQTHAKGKSRDPFAIAEALPFKSGKTTKNPKLTEQFNQANMLMNAFRDQSAPLGDVFDVARLAKYVAMTDVFDAVHGVAWHNLRFYYNPITRKLEPIGFDGYTETGPEKSYSGLFFGEYKSSKTDDPGKEIYQYMFRDETFNKIYTEALLEFSSTSYLSNLLDTHKEEIYSYERQINAYVDSDYRFDLSKMRERIRKIRNDIIPYPQISLKVYRELDQSGNPTFWATNNNSLPLEVFGGSTKNEGEVLTGEVQLINSNLRGNPKSYTQISLPQDAKQACFRLPGLDSTFYTEVYKWQRPSSGLKINYSSGGEPKLPLTDGAYTTQGKTITIRSGKHVLTSPIVIPADHTLVVEAGAELDFTKKSYLLSYGTFHCQGTKGNPILFTSSDKSAQGVTTIQAKGTSHLSYTTFSHFNTLEENEWQLTGAVTFYESDVDFDAVTVSHNLCEDALNLVRSNFDISGLNINHTFADGFDGDFCKGTLRDSYLFKTGNDGLDYSGSWVTISNVTLDQIGDKGISAGEQAHLVIDDVRISNAQIGIASKDLSDVTVSNTTLTDCNQGFAAYRKKPEFGGGHITVKSYEAKNVKRGYNADDESTITLPH